jgi:hypothetical protein
MSLKYGIFNLFLLLIVAVLGMKNYEVWTHSVEMIAEEEGAKTKEPKTEMVPAVVSQKKTVPIASYVLTAQKNIFSPERKDFPIVPVQKKSVVRPQLILFGVTIAGDYEAASITSPGRPLMKGERETLTLKVGERLGEYKLAKVLPDRIKLQNMDDSFEVLLYDPSNPKKRMEVKTVVKPPSVTSTQPAPPPPSPTAAEAPKPPAAPGSTEKPKEPPQQQIVPAPSPSMPRSYFPPPSVRRGRPSVYPPAGNSSQTNEQNLSEK